MWDILEPAIVNDVFLPMVSGLVFLSQIVSITRNFQEPVWG